MIEKDCTPEHIVAVSNLILVDYESVHQIDLSRFDASYRAIIFVGVNQNPPKAARNKATAHRFNRADFQKIEGSGKNALDFHIAFHLGRTFETARNTVCTILSKDKGFDPLLLHLNKNGLKCRRVNSLDELLPAAIERDIGPEEIACQRCKKASTIEHLGGRWCSNCGLFAVPPDASQLISNPRSSQGKGGQDHFFAVERAHANLPECAWCNQQTNMGDGIYDDGEWMCGSCVASYMH